jgi:hypothetical protein
MTEYFYNLAGIRYRFLIPADSVWDSVRTLAGYAAQPGPWDVECVLSITRELDAPEGERCFHTSSIQVYLTEDSEICYHGSVASTLDGAFLRLERRGMNAQIQLKASCIPKGITDDVILLCMQAVHHISRAGGFLLHASWIRYKGKGILFTGPSGIGKSTQAALWEQLRGAELINGDRAAIFPTAGGAEIRGIPFCGSSRVNKNETMPLAAVVVLTQAPENSITRLSGLRAFRQIWEGCSVNLWNQEDIARGTQAVVDAVSAVPVFHLACTPDERAVLTLEKEVVI